MAERIFRRGEIYWVNIEEEKNVGKSCRRELFFLADVHDKNLLNFLNAQANIKNMK